MNTETFSSKSNANRSARRALGPEAIPGQDYVILTVGARFAWEPGSITRTPATVVSAGQVDDVQPSTLVDDDAEEIVDDTPAPAPAPVATATPKAKAKAEPKAKPASDKPMSARARNAQAEVDAAKGVLPPQPDLSADAGKTFRPRLATMVEMAEAGDVAGLRAYKVSKTDVFANGWLKWLERYRTLAIIALDARATVD